MGSQAGTSMQQQMSRIRLMPPPPSIMGEELPSTSRRQFGHVMPLQFPVSIIHYFCICSMRHVASYVCTYVYASSYTTQCVKLLGRSSSSSRKLNFTGPTTANTISRAAATATTTTTTAPNAICGNGAFPKCSSTRRTYSSQSKLFVV